MLTCSLLWGLALPFTELAQNCIAEGRTNISDAGLSGFGDDLFDRQLRVLANELGFAGKDFHLRGGFLRFGMGFLGGHGEGRLCDVPLRLQVIDDP